MGRGRLAGGRCDGSEVGPVTGDVRGNGDRTGTWGGAEADGGGGVEAWGRDQEFWLPLFYQSRLPANDGVELGLPPLVATC